MPIDAGLYGQFAPRVVSPMEIQNGLAQQQTNALAAQEGQLKLQGMQQSMADQTQVRNALANGADLSTPEGRAAFQRAAPIGSQPILKGQADIEKLRSDITLNQQHGADFDSQMKLRQLQQAKDQTTLMAQQLSAAKGPQDVAPIYQQHVSSGFLDPQKAQQDFSTMPQTPGPEFDAWKAAKLQQGVSVVQQQEQAQKALEEQGRNARSAAERQTQVQTANIHAGATLGAAKIGATASTSNNAETNRVHLLGLGYNPDGTPTANVENEAQMIAAGKAPPPTGVSALRPAAMTVMKRVTEINPQFDSADWAAKAQAVKAFATGKDGQAVQAANTALNHLDTLRQLASAQNNGDIQTVNDIKNRIAKEFGGTAPANLQAAAVMVGPEISKAVIGVGGGQGDRDKVDSALKSLTSGNAAQQAGVLGTMEDLFGGRLTEAQRTYQRTTKNNDFSALLSPAAQAVLARRTGAPAHPADVQTILDKYKK